MSVLRNSSSKTLREVGLGVGGMEIVGANEIEGDSEGIWVMLGGTLGVRVGSDEIDGCILGSADVEGSCEG